MTGQRFSLVFIGLSITSSWGNGHATTYRGLVRELAASGHDVLFLERDMPWYASHRDLPHPEDCRLGLYQSLRELQDRYAGEIRNAKAVIVGSYVPEGSAVGEWVLRTAKGVTAFYDIDTPVTLAALARGDCEYLSAELIPRYDIYFSFSGGATLERLEREFGAPRALPLYCSAEPGRYFPLVVPKKWDLGYLGTYSIDRQPGIERLLLEPARVSPLRTFAVAGPQYPPGIVWPRNVSRIEHLPPGKHCAFYNSQRFTLNITRADMIAAGYSPSVRLFEAAACGTPIISDWWPGLDSILDPGSEILIAHSSDEVLEILNDLPSAQREAVGASARRRILASHTAAHRAAELISHIHGAAPFRNSRAPVPAERVSETRAVFREERFATTLAWKRTPR